MKKNKPQCILVQLFSALAMFAGIILIMGCEGTQDTSGADKPRSTLERIHQEKVVRLGYANEAPYAYMDNETGQLTGESPEIAKKILKQMGIKHIEGVLTEFGSLIPGLKAKRFDIIAAGMYITPQRCREIAFSKPTYGIGEAFIVQAGNPLNLHSYEDVASHPSARIGVTAGAVELQYARSTGIPNDRIVILPDPPSAVAAVQAKRVDAFAATSLTVHNLLAKTDTRIERARPFHDPVINGKTVVGYGAFGFRKEDKKLLAEFNKHLEKFIGTTQHLSLIEPFGFTEADLPGEITVAQLCQPND
ncbi:ectoine/hydroxyectoine ABC transporter solute-binding protein [Nitrosococcus halophilus Nc 4]|uniref:Ectoine/hydroxyectoine ABC transporter solute-binding protein n=1 Tax=Nitrosococcus halophilus (strain Nc4) TaxID=472759 RepID=D5BX97_NITHN|nr:ectoine/hydroxyectoine ABC transporter substrate-binding protein EhuB [Nitrosococcus halophilus]ADE15780.1 ectoine/hydroxyectoine ABC transporter solute-binding protein [Nitrosococcus halophilus Nc 4]